MMISSASGATKINITALISTMNVQAPDFQWNSELIGRVIDNIFYARKEYEKCDNLLDVYAAIGSKLSIPASNISALIAMLAKECNTRTNHDEKIEGAQDLFRVISKLIKMFSKEGDARRKYCEQLHADPKPTKSCTVSKPTKSCTVSKPTKSCTVSKPKKSCTVSKPARRPWTPQRPSVPTQQRSSYRKILPRVVPPPPPPLPEEPGTSVKQNVNQQTAKKSPLITFLLLNDRPASVSESCNTILDIVEKSADMKPFTHSAILGEPGTRGPSTSGSKHHTRMENDGSQPQAKIPRQGSAAESDPECTTDRETTESDHFKWSQEIMERVLQDMVKNENKYKSYTLLQVSQEISQKLKIPIERTSGLIQIMATKYRQRHTLGDNVVQNIGKSVQPRPEFTATDEDEHIHRLESEGLPASADSQTVDVLALPPNFAEAVELLVKDEPMSPNSLESLPSPENEANAVRVLVKDEQTSPCSIQSLPLPLNTADSVEPMSPSSLQSLPLPLNTADSVELLVKDEPMSPNNLQSLIIWPENITDTVELLVKDEPTSPCSHESVSPSTLRSSSPSSLPPQPLLSTDQSRFPQSTLLTTCGHGKSQLPIFSPSNQRNLCGESSVATDCSQMLYTRDLLISLAAECARMELLLPTSTASPAQETSAQVNPQGPCSMEESESFHLLSYSILVMSQQLTELAKLASSACYQGTSARVNDTNNGQQVLHSMDTQTQGTSAILNEKRTTITRGQPQNQRVDFSQLPFKFSGQNGSQDLQASERLSACERQYLKTMNMRTEILAGIWNELKTLRRELCAVCSSLQSTTT